MNAIHSILSVSVALGMTLADPLAASERQTPSQADAQGAPPNATPGASPSMEPNSKPNPESSPEPNPKPNPESIPATSPESASAPPRPPAAPPPATPPTSSPPRVIGGDPLEVPGRKEGATVLGERESAEAAQAVRQTPSEPSTRTAPPADPRQRAILELHRRLFPPPLTEAEVDAWCLALGLEADAVAHARALVEEYRARLRREAGGETISLVVGSYRWGEQGDGLLPLWTPVRVALILRRGEYLKALNAAESQLRAALMSLVIIERQAEARRLFFHRRFQIESPGEPGTLAGLDLASLVRECEFEAVDLDVLAPVLDAYITEADRLFARRLEAMLDLELRLANLEIGLGPHWALVGELVSTPDEQAELALELGDLHAARSDLDRPLAAATRNAILAIASRLSPTGLTGFVDRLLTLLPRDMAEEEVGLARLLASALAEGSLSPEALQGRRGFQAAVRLKLLPLGLEVGELGARVARQPFVRTGDMAIDRANAVERLETEVLRLEVMRRRRAICLDAAESLKLLLQAPEQRLNREIEQFIGDLRMRSSAEAWIAARTRERINEILYRQAEDELAAERAAAEEQEAAAPQGQPGGSNTSTGGTDGPPSPGTAPGGFGGRR